MSAPESTKFKDFKRILAKQLLKLVHFGNAEVGEGRWDDAVLDNDIGLTTRRELDRELKVTDKDEGR